MKALKYTLIAVVLLATGTAFGATAKKIIEVYQKDNIATVYVGNGDIKIYKVDDGKNTCYISTQALNDGGVKFFQHSTSCVKN